MDCIEPTCKTATMIVNRDFGCFSFCGGQGLSTIHKPLKVCRKTTNHIEKHLKGINIDILLGNNLLKEVTYTQYLPE